MASTRTTRWYAVPLLVAAACGQVLSQPDASVDASAQDAGAVDAPGDLGQGADTVADAADATDASADEDAIVEAGCPAVVHTGSTANTFQIDSLHSGAQIGDELTLPLCQRWRHTFVGPVSYPVVGSGNVFVTVDDQTNADLWALDEETGANAWGPVAVASGTSWSVPAYDDGLVFVEVWSGTLEAFDALTGTVKWKTSVPGYVESPPTPWGGLLFVNGSNGLYALNETDGSVAWSRVLSGTYSSATVEDGGLFAVYGCNEAYAFEPLDGSVHWHHAGSCYGGSGATPRVQSDTVYARSTPDDLMLSALDGSTIGPYSTGTIPVYGGPNVAVMGWGTSVRAVTTPAMTNVLWTFNAPNGFVESTPIVVGSDVVVGSSSGWVYVIDVATGTEVGEDQVGTTFDFPNEWSTQQPLTGLAAADGMLFVPAHDTLVAY